MTEPATSGQYTDRRNFLRCSACGLIGIAALSLPGCGGGAGEPPTSPININPKNPTDTTRTVGDTVVTTGPKGVKFEIAGSQIRVFVANIPELDKVPSAFLIEPALTIVVRTGSAAYSALTAVCTHEGCTVTGFSSSHLVCPCHGSTYDLDGEVLVGPAASPLVNFNSSFDSTKKELLITKSS